MFLFCFSHDYFVSPRKLAADFSYVDQALSLFYRVRLKRKHSETQRPSSFTINSSISCVYSTYLVALSQFICYSIESISIKRVSRRMSVTTQQVMDEYGALDKSSSPIMHPIEMFPTPTCAINSQDILLANSQNNFCDIAANDGTQSTKMYLETSPIKCTSEMKKQLAFLSDDTEDFHLKVLKSSKLALKVCFEVLNCLTKMDYTPDELVYRCLAEACADCGESDRLVTNIFLIKYFSIKCFNISIRDCVHFFSLLFLDSNSQFDGSNCLHGC